MKILIVADIHANYEALDAVLEKEGFDRIICAGDLIGYGVRPNKVVQALKSQEADIIQGNHDASAVGQFQARFNPSAELALEYNREDLEDENWEFLEDLPESLRDQFDGADIAVFHGSPRRLDEYVYRKDVDGEFISENFEQRPDVVVMAHTHVPYSKTVSDVEVVNPGSVGQPRDRRPEASYAVLDTGDMSVELKRTAYDVEKAAEEVEEKLTERLAERLREGR
ncbi:MAG: metallophosphoesterase [Candidatus Nanohaloarchaea archaeon]